MTRIAEALRFIVEAHHGQVDWGGNPFVGHPLRVAAYTAAQGDAADYVIIAALLHDTVEDTHVTLMDIEYHFGRDIREIVDALSRRKSEDDRVPSETYKEYIERLLQGPDEALFIKLADLRDNMDEDRIPYERLEEHRKMSQKRYVITKELIEIELKERGLR